MIDIRKLVKYHNLVNITDYQIKTLGFGIITLLDVGLCNEKKIYTYDLMKYLYENYGALTSCSQYTKNGVKSGLIRRIDESCESRAEKEEISLWAVEFPIDEVIKTFNAIDSGEIDYNYLNIKNGINSYKYYKKLEQEGKLKLYETFPNRRVLYLDRCKVYELRERYYYKLLELGKIDVLGIIDLREEWKKEDSFIIRISKGRTEEINKNYIPLQQKYQKLIDDLDRV